VGTRGAHDQPTDKFDTPPLIEAWRTAPYLHDGSVTTIREVLTSRHGTVAHLNDQELSDLIEYVLSL
jgi:cytochrome c peroxidase